MTKKIAILLCCLTAHALYSGSWSSRAFFVTKTLTGVAAASYPAWLYSTHKGDVTKMLTTVRQHKNFALDTCIAGLTACKSDTSKFKQGGQQIKDGLTNLASGAQDLFDKATKSPSKKDN